MTIKQSTHKNKKISAEKFTGTAPLLIAKLLSYNYMDRLKGSRLGD